MLIELRRRMVTYSGCGGGFKQTTTYCDIGHHMPAFQRLNPAAPQNRALCISDAIRYMRMRHTYSSFWVGKVKYCELHFRSMSILAL